MLNESDIIATTDSIVSNVTSMVPTSPPFKVHWTADLIASVAIGAIGIVSNAFAIIVLGYDKKLRSKIMNKFLINQSLIDFWGSFFILVNLPTEDTGRILGDSVFGK